MRHLWPYLLLAAACGEVTTNGNDNPPPLIEDVSPGRGGVPGGHTITITGSGFVDDDAGDNHVVVGVLAATDVDAEDDATLTFTLPPGPAPGAVVDVLVFNDNGFAARADAIVYNAFPTIKDVTPNYGRSPGGDTASVFGTGFEDFEAGDAVVILGTVEATDVEVVSDTEVTFTVPQRPGDVLPFEWVPVTLQNANGTASVDDGFRWTAPGIIATAPGGSYGGQSSNILWIDVASKRIAAVADLAAQISGMAGGPDGTLYVSTRCQANPQLAILDPFTGTLQVIGPIVQAGTTTPFGITEMTFVGDVLYGHTSPNGSGGISRLVIIDTATAGATLQGDADDGLGPFCCSTPLGITARNDTTIWSISNLSGLLQYQNKDTSVVTSTGITLTGPGEGTYDLLVDDGSILAVTRNSRSLVRINTTTGTVTPILEFGSRVTAIEFTPDTF